MVSGTNLHSIAFCKTLPAVRSRVQSPSVQCGARNWKGTFTEIMQFQTASGIFLS
jgi:hypothetical protein